MNSMTRTILIRENPTDGFRPLNPQSLNGEVSPLPHAEY